MREPRFWSGEPDPRSRDAAPLTRFLLTPFAWLYATITARKIATGTSTNVNATVICIGNISAGGVGKSPVVAALRARISNQTQHRTATLSRGFGGRLKGPLKIDPNIHTAAEVGDEPLMLSHSGESWIGANRGAAGQAMTDNGVDVILMDDGHQNPGLAKDLSLIVVDAKTKFGNGFVIPKGPLREPVAKGLARADAIILIGDGPVPEEAIASDLPVLHALIVPVGVPPSIPLVAFAGIGRPEKVFETLQNAGADVRETVPFPDHHVYSDRDLKYLRNLASDHQATLITTEKDYVRLKQYQRDNILTLQVQAQFKDTDLLDRILASVLKADPA